MRELRLRKKCRVSVMMEANDSDVWMSGCCPDVNSEVSRLCIKQLLSWSFAILITSNCKSNNNILQEAICRGKMEVEVFGTSFLRGDIEKEGVG